VFVNEIVWSGWIGLNVEITEYFSLWLLPLHFNLYIKSYCSFSICHHIGFFFI